MYKNKKSNKEKENILTFLSARGIIDQEPISIGYTIWVSLFKTVRVILTASTLENIYNLLSMFNHNFFPVLLDPSHTHIYMHINEGILT